MHLIWYSWLIGFGLTLLFELPLLVWLLSDELPSIPRRLAIAVVANLITHPLVWFFFSLLPLVYVWRLAISECWAFAGEGLFYFVVVSRIGFKRAFLVSLAANATSFGLGWVVLDRWGRFLF